MQSYPKNVISTVSHRIGNANDRAYHSQSCQSCAENSRSLLRWISFQQTTIKNVPRPMIMMSARSRNGVHGNRYAARCSRHETMFMPTQYQNTPIATTNVIRSQRRGRCRNTNVSSSAKGALMEPRSWEAGEGPGMSMGRATVLRHNASKSTGPVPRRAVRTGVCISSASACKPLPDD